MVAFVVDGETVALARDPSTPLHLALRNDPVRACQTPLSAVEGAEVTTPEGLCGTVAKHPVPQAFLAEQAAQCGYCVNGIIMSLAGPLARQTAPDERHLRDTLDGHLCRCGTHHRILRAARRAAGQQPIPPPAPEVAPDPDGAVPALDGLPAVLRATPRVEQWLRPLPDGRVEVSSGRVELGQGVRTALAQIVASELDLPPDRVVMRPVATGDSPDEGYTVGSNSLQQGGVALAYAAAAYRRLRDAGLPPQGLIEAGDRPRWRGGAIGDAVARTDLAEKVAGAAAFLHDLALPGMVHARVLLPPAYAPRPLSVDIEPVRRRPGVLAVLHDGALLMVVAQREEQATAAVAALARLVRWDGSEPAVDTDLATVAGEPVPVVAEDGVEAALAGHRAVHASYTKPYEAHAAIAPSVAVALAGPDRLQVWTHSQGVYPLRRELAALLGTDESHLVVRHVDGPGCYGHNGADDAAGFAAVAARAVPGTPVRFQYSVHDEFRWEPYGPPVRGDLTAGLDGAGRIVAWRHRIRSGPQMARPHGSGDRLVAAWLRPGGRPLPVTGGGGVALRRVVTACDAGVVVNPDGLRNQMEGGTLQSLSRALHEQVPAGAASLDWTSYPVLRFAEVPELVTVLVGRPGSPPLGAGEAATPVTPAALANAVDDAVGIRVRDLPLTAGRLRRRLEEMTGAEAARVRL
jgi:nicotinate dehydrogenase subunit B